jgi:myo-inositol-1(or 4)-monophosphatase
MSPPDWLGVCRRAVESQRRIFAEVRGIPERTQYVGRGEGGDQTLVIDRRAEDAIFSELEGLAAEGSSFIAISEERGEVAFGADADGDGDGARVIIDPIDGSLNARRMIPSYSVSIAVASGPSMADVELGYVYDFGADEEFVALRGEGAAVNGEPIRAESPYDGLEVVGLEAAKPEWVVPATEALLGKVFRFRGIGSIAINLAYVAAGRMDGMITLRPCRSVDAAAGQLIVREAGGRLEFPGLELAQAGLGLDERYTLVAACTDDGLATLNEASRKVEASK